MSVKKLMEMLPPPEHPIENGSTMSWQEVETQVGTRLPGDYKAFITAYGSGVIGKLIYIWNPFSPVSYRNLFKTMGWTLHDLHDLSIELKEKLDPESFPYPIFPQPGGILPFGSTINGDVLFWLTQGDPDEWTIVVNEVRTIAFEEYPMSFTEFLTELLKDEIQETIIFHESSFDRTNGFVPDSPGI